MYTVSSSVGFFTTAKNDVFIFYVILSASEISHDRNEKYILYGGSPSREFARSTFTQ